jgi:hypothetical protein
MRNEPLFSDMPSEVRPLLALLQRHPRPEHIQRVFDWLAGGGDTQSLFLTAEKHGLLPLLYRGLVNLPGKSGDLAALTDQVTALVTANAIFYEFVYPQQLAVVLAALNKVEIETLIFKGYSMGQWVYRQPLLRPYNDYDILIPASKTQRAEAILIGLGYKPDESEYSREWYRENHHHLAPLVHPTYLAVELHQGLVTPTGNITIDLDAIWARSSAVTVNGVTTRALCPEHLVIYLCLHAVHTHLFEIGLRTLCDVYETLVEYEQALDWQTIVQTSRLWRCQPHLYLTLRLVEAAFEINLPEDSLRQLDDGSFDEAFLRYSLANIFGHTIHGLQQSSGLAQLWHGQSGLRGKINLALGKLFPPKETLAQTFHVEAHHPLIWLYYPRWQFRLLGRHFSAGMDLLRANADVTQEAQHEVVRRKLADWLEAPKAS